MKAISALVLMLTVMIAMSVGMFEGDVIQVKPPTKTPKPTHTPKPTKTPKLTHTPRPTFTPIPTATELPTLEPAFRALGYCEADGLFYYQDHGLDDSSGTGGISDAFSIRSVTCEKLASWGWDCHAYGEWCPEENEG